MSRRLVLALTAACVGSVARIAAQEPPERTRTFCDDGEPRNRCPGPDCACLEDTLEVTFDGASRSVLEHASLAPGAEVETVIVTDTRTEGIQGWSYAVEHDDAYLTLLDVTLEETEAERGMASGFAVADRIDIVACPHGDGGCRDSRPGAGYFSAVVLGYSVRDTLALQRNHLCVARYALRADPGPNGTLIQLVHEHLGKRGSPPVAINLTVNSRSRRPATLIDGWIKAAGEAVLEICGNGIDDEGDARIDYDDPECRDVPSCCPELCANGRDDDRDGLGDCADPDCLGFDPCGPRLEDCSNSRDDDGNGLTDCADPACFASQLCAGRPEVCNNGLDDDHDGAVDCSDLECAEAVTCPPRAEVCSGFRDEDRDGLVDCQDPDCLALEDCLPGPERTRVFCDAADPANRCPGAECRCVEDTLEVTFDGQADSVFQYETFVAGTEIQTAIVTDTRSSPVQGWSYAVEHDASYLTLLDVTIQGTDADSALWGGFVVADRNDIEACLPNDPGCRHPVPGSGFVSAVILSFGAPLELYLKRNTLCRATYSLAADSGAGGTLIQVVDGRLKKRFSPPVDVSFTVNGRSTAPVHLVDGWVKLAGEPLGGPGGEPQGWFIRGDVNGSGRINVVDAIALLGILDGTRSPVVDCDDLLDVTDDGRIDAIDALHLLRYVFSRGPGPPAPFPTCGSDPTAEAPSLACGEPGCR